MSGGEWAVFDRGGELACLPVIKTAARALFVGDGERVRRGRVWMLCGADYSALLPDARKGAAEINIEELWRAAAGKSLTPEELARCGGKTKPAEILSVLQAALDNPAYFRRGGGRFVPAPEEVLIKIRHALRRRAEESEEENRILAQLKSGPPPPEIKRQCGALLNGDDKNGVLYRAVKKAAGGARQIPEWLVQTGICAGAEECWRRLFEHCWPPRPEGVVSPPPDLPPSPARAFSIDEAGTFEVDDAFSVRRESDGSFIIGVHIAVPALDFALFADDDYGSRRLVSVYLSAEKYPMLPSPHLSAYSLLEGGMRPALSLLVRFNPESGEMGGAETRLESVNIVRNYTPEDFDGGAPGEFAGEYKVLSEFAAVLPSLPPRERTDFRIFESPPRVVCLPRRPSGLLVEKLMRFANTEWAKLLAGKGGLFRVNGATFMRPDAKRPYAWTTSPLRRFADLANQRLLLYALGLAPRPRIRWRELAREFSSQHTKARRFQNITERHWILRAVESLPSGAVLPGRRGKDGKVRLSDYPLGGSVAGGAAKKLPPDTPVKVRVLEINLFNQSARFELV